MTLWSLTELAVLPLKMLLADLVHFLPRPAIGRFSKKPRFLLAGNKVDFTLGLYVLGAGS